MKKFHFYGLKTDLLAKILNFSRLRRLSAKQANIFVQIKVNFDKKSTKIFTFSSEILKFSRVQGRSNGVCHQRAKIWHTLSETGGIHRPAFTQGKER